jgi:hypothetical protein
MAPTVIQLLLLKTLQSNQAIVESLLRSTQRHQIGSYLARLLAQIRLVIDPSPEAATILKRANCLLYALIS